MADFELPDDLKFNTEPIADPEAFAREREAVSWLYLCGEEFAAMEGGMSYDSVQAAVPDSAQVVSDPPRTMDMDLARKQLAALDELPRPTLVTCRRGPRSSAVIYLYAGLEAGASADEVIARARADEAPFAGSEELEAWVRQGLAAETNIDIFRLPLRQALGDRDRNQADLEKWEAARQERDGFEKLPKLVAGEGSSLCSDTITRRFLLRSLRLTGNESRSDDV